MRFCNLLFISPIWGHMSLQKASYLTYTRLFEETILSAQISLRILLIFAAKIVMAPCICMEYRPYDSALS